MGLAGNFQFTQFSVDWTEQVTLSTCNPDTNFDTQISVFVCDGDGLTCVAAEDENGDGTVDNCSILTITAEADVVYFVVVSFCRLCVALKLLMSIPHGSALVCFTHR